MTTRCIWSVCTCYDKIFQIGFVFQFCVFIFIHVYYSRVILSPLPCRIFSFSSPFSLNISPFLPFPNYWWALCSKIFAAVFLQSSFIYIFFAKPLDGLCLCVFVTVWVWRFKELYLGWAGILKNRNSNY